MGTLSVSDVESKMIKLAMDKDFVCLREFQKRPLACLLRGERVVEAQGIAGCGKTRAIVALIVALLEMDRLKVASSGARTVPAPVYLVVTKEKTIVQRLAGELRTFGYNHAAFAKVDSPKEFKTWVKMVGSNEFIDAAAAGIDALDVMNRRVDAVCRFQSSIAPGEDVDVWNRVEFLETVEADIRSRLFPEHIQNSAKKQKMSCGGPLTRLGERPKIFPVRNPELQNFATERPLTLIVTYDDLGSACRWITKIGRQVTLVAFDEAYTLENNAKSCRWKKAVDLLSAKYTYMFSAMPIKCSSDAWMRDLQHKSSCVSWSAVESIKAQETVATLPVLGRMNWFDLLQCDEKSTALYSKMASVYTEALVLDSARAKRDFERDQVKIAVCQAVALLVGMVTIDVLHCKNPLIPKTSPCRNGLLLVKHSCSGLASQELIRALLNDVDAYFLWFSPLIQKFMESFEIGGDDARDVVRIIKERLVVENWFKSANVLHPFDSDNEKSRVVDEINRPGGTFANVLIASKWPEDGTDIANLHCISLAPANEYDRNMSLYVGAKVSRAAIGKKYGFVFLLDPKGARNVRGKFNGIGPKSSTFAISLAHSSEEVSTIDLDPEDVDFPKVVEEAGTQAMEMSSSSTDRPQPLASESERISIDGGVDGMADENSDAYEESPKKRCRRGPFDTEPPARNPHGKADFDLFAEPGGGKTVPSSKTRDQHAAPGDDDACLENSVSKSTKSSQRRPLEMKQKKVAKVIGGGKQGWERFKRYHKEEHDFIINNARAFNMGMRHLLGTEGLLDETIMDVLVAKCLEVAKVMGQVQAAAGDDVYARIIFDEAYNAISNVEISDAPVLHRVSSFCSELQAMVVSV